MTWIIKSIIVIAVITFVLGIYNKVRERKEMEKLRKNVADAMEKHRHPETKVTFPDDRHFN